jgi:phosphate transport system substrate-binding protein
MPADFRVSLTDAPGEAAYPVAGFTWFLVYREQPDPAKGRALVTFLWWAIHDGQAYAPELRYAPLPAAVVTRVEVQLRDITTGGRPLLAAR